MPLLSTRWLSSLPVKYGHQSIGRTVRVWFDVDTGQALGLFIGRGPATKLLDRDQARLVEDHVTLSQPDALTTPVKPSRAEAASRSRLHLIGAAVETVDGRRVGILRDLLLTEYDWRIVQLVVQDKAGDRLLSREVIVRLTDNLVTVSNEVLDGQTPAWLAPPSLKRSLVQ